MTAKAGLEHQAHDAAIQLASQNSSRYTPTKRRIVEFLWHSSHPKSVREIQSSLRNIPQSSIYRNIESMVAWGLLTKVTTSANIACFEVSEMISGSHHHHIICAQCGAIRDFMVPVSIESGLDRQLTKIARNEGFEFLHHQLDVIGVCGRCL